MKSKPESLSKLRLRVKDFGPIGVAEVELRPLTVFLGPSNTGKSYLAMLTHVLSKYLSARKAIEFIPSDKPGEYIPMPAHLSRFRDAFQSFSGQERAVFEQWLMQGIGFGSQSDDSATVPFARLEPLIRIGVERSDERSETLDILLQECFGISDREGFIRRKSTRGAQIAVVSENPVGAVQAKIDVSLSAEELDVISSIASDFAVVSSDEKVKKIFEAYGSLSPASEEAIHEDFRQDVLGRAFASLCSTVSSPFESMRYGSHYLPADRTGLMRTYQFVLSSLIRNATHGGGDSNGAMSQISGVSGEFLLHAMSPRQKESRFEDFASKLERDVLKGSIGEEREMPIHFPSFYYHPKNWADGQRIALMNASSMVTELAPIVLYLRYVMNEGELLIIEEPESHLHPAAQAELAVCLAKLVRAGVRVLLTTHSEWLLEQFSNLTRLGSLLPQQRSEVEGLHPKLRGAALDGSDVGAWIFDPPSRSGGATVREFELGYGPSRMPNQYEDVMLRLYDEWQEVERHILSKAA